MSKPWNIPDLDGDENTRVCLLKILKVRFEEMISHEGLVLQTASVEAVHDMRVSARRILSTLKFFRVCFPKKKLKRIYQEFKSIRSALGDARGHDIVLESLQETLKGASQDSSRTLHFLIAREINMRNEKKTALLLHLKRMTRDEFLITYNSFLEKSLGGKQ